MQKHKNARIERSKDVKVHRSRNTRMQRYKKCIDTKTQIYKDVMTQRQNITITLRHKDKDVMTRQRPKGRDNDPEGRDKDPSTKSVIRRYKDIEIQREEGRPKKMKDIAEDGDFRTLYDTQTHEERKGIA
jgi:hypothetical protein